MADSSTDESPSYSSVIPLSHVLQSFSGPISEEHGWAIIHQSCLSMQYMDLSSQNPYYLIKSPSHILLTVDGMVHTRSFSRRESDLGREIMVSLSQGVAELGVSVYSALDYSLSEDESRMLSAGLDNLIDVMISADQSEDDGDEADEGIGEEVKGVDVLEQILSLCRHHLAVPEESVDHYKNVIRALVAESNELSQFMVKIAESDLLYELDRSEWTDIWTEVMEQLRQGSKLKKVNYSKTPLEFALTPYEMLMEDIRTRKYQLHPVTIPLEVQREARDIILDFIRSRPPLKPVSERELPIKCIDQTPQEMLMDDIRGGFARSSLRKTKINEKSLNINKLKHLIQVVEVEEVKVKKIIDLDENFLEHVLNFEENCDDILDTSPHKSVNDGTTNDEAESSSHEVSSYQNIMTGANLTDRKVESSSYSLIENVTSACTPVISKTKESKYSNWTKTLHTLNLNLEEVSHIRSTLTKAELEDRDLPDERKKEFEKGKTCFLCGLVKFGLFNWAVLCQLCRRYVCSSCVSKIALPSDDLKDIPVCSLTAQLSKEKDEVKDPAKSPTNWSSFSRNYVRHSLRISTRSTTHSSRTSMKPRRTRAKSIDKTMVAAIQSMKLQSSKCDIQHSVCTDCKDMLTSIIRAQRMETKLDQLGCGFRGCGEGN